MNSQSHPLSPPQLSWAWDRLLLRNLKIECLFVYISDVPMSQGQDPQSLSQCPHTEGARDMFRELQGGRWAEQVSGL